MLDFHDAPSAAAMPHANDDGMAEPGIFKGCSTAGGALPAATKSALLTYLGKPNAAAWEQLAQREIAGSITLGDAWSSAAPSGSRRFPSTAELIRAIRHAAAKRHGTAAPALSTAGLRTAH